MANRSYCFSWWLFALLVFLCLSEYVTAASEEHGGELVVKRNRREAIVSNEYGEISRVRLSDGNQTFHLHFFTLEPNSLLLPLLLHQDMVFYVHTGSGTMSYQDIDEDERENRQLRRGDIHRLRAGTVFFLQSDLESERQKLRIHAIFGNSGPSFNEATTEPYSSIRDLVLGFDKKVLQQIFEVPEEVIEELTSGEKPQAIVHGVARQKKTLWEIEQEYMGDVLSGSLFLFSNKQKKSKSKFFNIFSDKPDFENCNGWSTTVNRKKYSPLKNSQFGIFMVNLTTGSMMGPHWNPMATEVAVVLQGKGMVRVVCPGSITDTACKNSRFDVEEGDVFVVPRYHPMAHMSFDNETLVFVGFSTSTRKNHPQFIAGEASVLRALDKQIVARSFGVSNETLDQLLTSQRDSVILQCTSCAEEEWRLLQEEIEREREEQREREEEEARRREEEQRREEEERREREEEEARREEEQRREEEERREREEEEARRREEEERREREEEEARRREEEEREQREREEKRRGGVNRKKGKLEKEKRQQGGRENDRRKKKESEKDRSSSSRKKEKHEKERRRQLEGNKKKGRGRKERKKQPRGGGNKSRRKDKQEKESENEHESKKNRKRREEKRRPVGNKRKGRGSKGGRKKGKGREEEKRKRKNQPRGGGNKRKMREKQGREHEHENEHVRGRNKEQQKLEGKKRQLDAKRRNQQKEKNDNESGNRKKAKEKNKEDGMRRRKLLGKRKKHKGKNKALAEQESKELRKTREAAASEGGELSKICWFESSSCRVRVE